MPVGLEVDEVFIHHSQRKDGNLKLEGLGLQLRLELGERRDGRGTERGERPGSLRLDG